MQHIVHGWQQQLQLVDALAELSLIMADLHQQLVVVLRL
jgi:hypothetical protein